MFVSSVVCAAACFAHLCPVCLYLSLSLSLPPSLSLSRARARACARSLTGALFLSRAFSLSRACALSLDTIFARAYMYVHEIQEHIYVFCFRRLDEGGATSWCTHAHTHTHTRTHVHIHAHTHIYAQTHIHTHAHTHRYICCGASNAQAMRGLASFLICRWFFRSD